MNDQATQSAALQRIEGRELQAAPQSPEYALLQAVQHGAPIETIERLVALKERAEARLAKGAFSDAMQAAQRDMPQVRKDARNTQTNSAYARLETLNKAVVPVYTRHGFSLSFGTADCPNPECVRITCAVRHKAGHEEVHHADVPLDVNGAKGNANKTRTHGFGSSLSYGRRYLTMLIFNVSTGDDDDGNLAGGIQNDEEVRRALQVQLWSILRPVRGSGSGSDPWEIANRWLHDETPGALPDHKKATDLTAEELLKAIKAAKAKLVEWAAKEKEYAK